MSYAEGQDLRFEKALPYILTEEGGWTNDPHDPGGATMYGIIQKEYDLYRHKLGLPYQSVRNISRAEEFDIYYNSYWLPHCPSLPAGLDLSFFDMCVNSGPRRATIILQGVLDIHQDGIWGLATDQAVRDLEDVPHAVSNYASLRTSFYRSLSTFRYFGKGWLARVQRIHTASLALAGPAQPMV